jgi:SPP1 family phage portal protein
MKTIEEILSQTNAPQMAIRDLMVKSKEVIPWAKLVREYEPKYHPVMTDKAYRDVVTKNGPVRQCRITLGLQKLAVKRMTELIFGIPVKRVYKAKDESEKKVAQIMEAIFRKNKMDSENIKRGRQFYASCEFATIWYTQMTDANYAGEKSRLKLRCKTYSPMTGALIYPLFDEYDDLIALSVQYTREVSRTTVTYFETYTDRKHIRWVLGGSHWEEELNEDIYIGKIPGVYAYRPEPIWEDESKNVFEAEWSLSRNGNYLRKNSRPNWVVFCDEDVTFGEEDQKDSAARNVLKYPASAKAGYQTWEQAIDSLKFHIETIRQNFFVQLQLPDMSFDTMKTTPMSGEARKMMFVDGQLKVTDESGDWLDVFYREINVVKAFMKKMYPSLEAAIESLDVDVVITPYNIKDDSEQIKNLTDATGGRAIMARRTAVRNFGMVDDVDEELKLIEEDESRDSMSGFGEPTM